MRERVEKKKSNWEMSRINLHPNTFKCKLIKKNLNYFGQIFTSVSKLSNAGHSKCIRSRYLNPQWAEGEFITFFLFILCICHIFVQRHLFKYLRRQVQVFRKIFKYLVLLKKNRCHIDGTYFYWENALFFWHTTIFRLERKAQNFIKEPWSENAWLRDRETCRERDSKMWEKLSEILLLCKILYVMFRQMENLFG